MRFNRYEKYKDSGVEWIGEIPEDWKMTKIKYNTYVKGRIGWQGLRADEFIDEGPYLVTGTDFFNGEILWENCYHITDVRYNEAPEIHLQEGDLLITKDGTIGKTAIVKNKPEKTTLNSGIFVTRPLNKSYITKYMYWLLNSSIFNRYIDYVKTGSTISHLYQETFENFIYPLPKFEEQKDIVNFLDKKITEVDNLITDKEKLIQLLHEKRQAIISEAVTKGIDPNVPMKDSGIEWIGDIPAHWEVKKVKHLTSYIGSGKTPKGGSEVYSQEGIVFIRSQNVYPQGLRLDDVVFINEDIDAEMKNTRVKKDDILLNITGASIGRASLVPPTLPRANVNQHVCILRPVKHKVLPELLHFIVCSNFIQNQIQFYQNGTSREGLNFEQIANLIIILPPEIKEQEKIFKEVSNKIIELDESIYEIQTQIEKLKEYRESLISEVVTGKIDIRDFTKARKE